MIIRSKYLKSLLIVCSVYLASITAIAQEKVPCRPIIEGEFWRIGQAPDLGELNGDDMSRQHVVDHGFVKDVQGTWHLWACIRGTKVGRLLYGWKGQSLEGEIWQQDGIKARADVVWGEQTEPQEKIQAPFFSNFNNKYYCFYNSAGIRIMTSEDGANFQRERIKEGNNVLYEKGGRDVMVLKDDNKFYAYSTVSTVAKDGWLRGFVIVRTSKDLMNWSDYTIVSEGGRAGNGAVSAESPFVVKYRGYFYLFRSSSSTGTVFVYRSDDPYNFGVNDDRKLIAELPVWAPEVLNENGQWYISDIADFEGVKLAKLIWQEDD
jgi:beta-fructofuranosidase